MKIRFLGTGSAFTMANFQTNLLLENGKRKMLIDAGGDIRFALKEAGVSYKDIDSIYITHGHADHIGGLEYLAFCSYFDPSHTKPVMYCNKGLVNDLWNNALSLGLSSLQGKICDINTYFSVIKIDDNDDFNWESARFETVQAVHIMNKYTIVKTFGLMITNKNKKTYITGDTQFNPNQIIDFYYQADTIIQDCETASFMSKVHAHYNELKTLPDEIRSKMYLVHYHDNAIGWEKKAKDDGFAAIVPKGFILEI